MNEKNPNEEKKVNEEDATAVVGGTNMGTELEINTDDIPVLETPSWANTTTPIIYTVYEPVYPQPYIEPPSPYFDIKDD